MDLSTVRSAGSRVTSGEWFRLAAWLLVSCGLHAALGLTSGAEPAVPQVVTPLTVSLQELPLSQPVPRTKPPAPKAAKPSRGSAAAAARRPQTPSPPAVITAAVAADPDADTAIVIEPVAETLNERQLVAADFASRLVSSQMPTEGDAAGVASGRGQGGNASGGGTGDGGDGGLLRATPRYETNPLPDYPRIARRNRWEGVVELRATVTAEGLVSRLSVERSSGHTVLDRSAVEGVGQWRFVPATRNGIPVACEVRIPVAFRLNPEP